jgi:hypothetical protein
LARQRRRGPLRGCCAGGRAEAPDEDLISLVYFYEADHDALIEALRPPIGRRSDYGPVVSAQFLKERLDAITVG